MTSNFRILSLFVDALESDTNKEFHDEKSNRLFRLEIDQRIKYIDVDIGFMNEILKFNGESIIFDLDFKIQRLNYEKLKDDIKTIDDIEFTLVYGRELTDENLLDLFDKIESQA